MNYSDMLDKIELQLEGEAHLDELARKKQDPFKILISTILSAILFKGATISTSPL